MAAAASTSAFTTLLDVMLPDASAWATPAPRFLMATTPAALIVSLSVRDVVEAVWNAMVPPAVVPVPARTDHPPPVVVVPVALCACITNVAPVALLVPVDECIILGEVIVLTHAWSTEPEGLGPLADVAPVQVRNVTKLPPPVGLVSVLRLIAPFPVTPPPESRSNAPPVPAAPLALPARALSAPPVDPELLVLWAITDNLAPVPEVDAVCVMPG